jgi:hypothetical protein
MSSYTPNQPPNLRRAVLLVVCWLRLVIVVVEYDRPPSAVSAGAAPPLFSADRALNHLAHISRAPHPINSSEHDQVRDYILNTLKDMGLSQDVQRRNQRGLLALVVLGRGAPQNPDEDPLTYSLPDAELLARLRGLKGTPELLKQSRIKGYFPANHPGRL